MGTDVFVKIVILLLEIIIRKDLISKLLLDNLETSSRSLVLLLRNVSDGYVLLPYVIRCVDFGSLVISQILNLSLVQTLEKIFLLKSHKFGVSDASAIFVN